MNHETAVSNAKEIADRILAPAARQNDKEARFSSEAVAALGPAGLLGITLPAELGGAALGPRTLAGVIATLAEADASAAMVEQLRAKPGGDSIPVTMGDMAQVPVSGRFRLVYLVFNTLFWLLSQARQAECFGNVARVLDPGGMFVIECFVPDLARFDRDQRVQAQSVTEDSAIIEVSRHDKMQQRVNTQIITLDGQGIHLRPVAIRYSWPAELDLMADRAGLRLTERYADWDRQPFTSASDGHVSVYQRA